VDENHLKAFSWRGLRPLKSEQKPKPYDLLINSAASVTMPQTNVKVASAPFFQFLKAGCWHSRSWVLAVVSGLISDSKNKDVEPPAGHSNRTIRQIVQVGTMRHKGQRHRDL
jgi:hypothetical protein